MPKPITGGCLCGAVRYECTHDVRGIVVCHCKDCRKASGSAAAYNSRVPAESITFTQGQPRTYVVTADSGHALKRLFCENCGSQLFSQREHLPQFYAIKVGSLDDPSALEISRHIWTRSAMPWVPLDPDVPHHEEEFAGLREPKLPG